MQSHDPKYTRVRALIREERRRKPPISRHVPVQSRWREAGQENTNKFLIGCILDYQIKVEVVWENANVSPTTILEIRAICGVQSSPFPGGNTESVRRRYNLHRFPAAHAHVPRCMRIDKRRNMVANSQWDFEELWRQIQRDISVGDTIENWTQHRGYSGDEFIIRVMDTRFIEVESPDAENSQRVPREDFSAVYELWGDYLARRVPRYQIRDLTRFSKYIISILHQVIDN